MSVLDKKLLEKIAEKRNNKNILAARKYISARATRHHITLQAAQVLIARELNIGTAVYERGLRSAIREEIRSNLPIIFPSEKVIKTNSKRSSKSRTQSPISLAIEYLVQDAELKDRCSDLLKRPANFDRVFREATTVLEHRLRELSGVKGMRPLDLVGKVVNPDPSKAILVVSEERSEQEGFYSICKGIILSFRDRSHHELTDKFSRQDALKFCSFIDSLLSILGRATKYPERI